MSSARWVVSGPHYADGWYLVENRAAIVPQLTATWFLRRAPARAYRWAVAHGHWKRARKIFKQEESR